MPINSSLATAITKRLAFFILVVLFLVIGTHVSGAALYADDLDTLYADLPVVAQCEPGKLMEREKARVLTYLNRIRRLHNLAPVVYAATYDQETSQASLLIAANQQMTHHPASTFDCFTETGVEGSATSNLAITFRGNVETPPLLSPSTADVSGWLIDPDVPELGHRRWLLNPFLRRIAYGRVDTMMAGTPGENGSVSQVGAEEEGVAEETGDNDGEIKTDFVPEFIHGAAMKVIYDENRPLPASAPSFVAYPYGDYPIDLFEIGWYWSFSVVADRADYWGNADVDFTNATVSVESEQGSHRVYDLSSNNDAAGLPNILQWQVEGVTLNELYRVEIDNVLVQEVAQSYAYTVTLTEPDLDALDLPVYRLATFTETLTIRSGETFALYVPPPYALPDSYAVSRPDIQMQMVDHSSYISILRVNGTIGDEVRFRFKTGTVTLRIAVTQDGVDDPLDALRSELDMPVYLVEGKDETVTAAAEAQFAVYIPPSAAENGIRRVQWSQPQGTQLKIEFHNERVLLITVAEGAPGAQSTVTLGIGKAFIVQVAQ